MLEFFAISKSIENFTTDESLKIHMQKTRNWVTFLISLLICIGTAYLAFSCNYYENPVRRALFTLFAFFFSGIYLLYYFIIHILMGYNCSSGKNITNIMKNFSHKNR